MNTHLPRHNIVLLGVGHTNAHIVRMWRMSPIRDAQLICISDFPVATYSGMLPGVLSGQYRPEQMQIDLVRMCATSGARMILDRVTGLDASRGQIWFEDRPPLPFDWISVGIGSRPSFSDVEIVDDSVLVAIKPMQTLLSRLRTQFERLKSQTTQAQIIIVGGGVAGIEVALCLNQRLHQEMGAGRFQITLLHGGQEIGTGLLPKTRRMAEEILGAAGVRVLRGHHVSRVERGALGCADGRQVEADLVMWATSAQANPLLADFGLERDDRGFLATHPTLQSVSNERVFAVGDSGTILQTPSDKAGVFAVRQGPVLWKNLHQAVGGKPLRNYVPQSGFLKLMNLGDGRALGEFQGRSFAGRLAWRWKDHIDRNFMKKYQDYRPMAATTPARPIPPATMRCVGCGGKLGGAILSEVLQQLKIRPNKEVLLGLGQADDAAIITAHDGQVTVTNDFFAAPLDDPFLVGRIAALNAASDCFAMGARPVAALATVQIPFGTPRGQQRILLELMLGAQREFDAMGATIAGGHSIEGPRLTIGFAVIAHQQTAPLIKGGLQPDDRLVLTKAIGTGALLAAMPRGDCRSEWYPALIQNMLGSNEIGLCLAQQGLLSALTDVTGFGLAGHLIEMLQASGVKARIELDSIPVLDGCLELIEQGIESTMAAENRHVEPMIHSAQTDSARYKALFDPQTGGGLLLGLPASKIDRLEQLLRQRGVDRFSVIGQVLERSSAPPLLIAG